MFEIGNRVLCKKKERIDLMWACKSVFIVIFAQQSMSSIKSPFSVLTTNIN